MVVTVFVNKQEKIVKKRTKSQTSIKKMLSQPRGKCYLSQNILEQPSANKKIKYVGFNHRCPLTPIPSVDFVACLCLRCFAVCSVESEASVYRDDEEAGMMMMMMECDHISHITFGQLLHFLT